MTSTAAHITQSPSPTPAADILGAAYLAQYEQGRAEGLADAATDLQAAIARSHYVIDYLAHPWEHGYWDGVFEQQVTTLTAAWNALGKE